MDLVDYVSRKKTPVEGSAEVPLDKGYLGRQRLPCKSGAPMVPTSRRISADFGHRGTIFHQNHLDHWSHAFEKTSIPGVGCTLPSDEPQNRTRLKPFMPNPLEDTILNSCGCVVF